MRLIGNAPSKISALWVGKWWYWRDYPAHSFAIDDIRLDPRAVAWRPAGTARVIAWAGFPVRGPDGHVVGALCVADHVPRHWAAGDVEVLGTLSHIASGEVALQVALHDGAERAALARTLQESLLPPRRPGIPGLRFNLSDGP